MPWQTRRIANLRKKSLVAFRFPGERFLFFRKRWVCRGKEEGGGMRNSGRPWVYFWTSPRVRFFVLLASAALSCSRPGSPCGREGRTCGLVKILKTFCAFLSFSGKSASPLVCSPRVAPGLQRASPRWSAAEEWLLPQLRRERPGPPAIPPGGHPPRYHQDEKARSFLRLTHPNFLLQERYNS